MSVILVRGDARALPLGDDTVDLIVTSPPYWGLRSYQDAGEHYEGQIGAEPTPEEYVRNLLDVTRECIRVLKPEGSLWINLGDKYADRAGPSWDGSSDRFCSRPPKPRRMSSTGMARRKSLLGLPWRYALACVDDLRLILREEVIWSKPNGLPESVTDRVRRSHEQWFHFTLRERYFAGLDEIREPYAPETAARYATGYTKTHTAAAGQTQNGVLRVDEGGPGDVNPLGKLPGSVWSIPTEPLSVPEWLGADHHAAFPTEWPRRLILGWSPRGICTTCGEALRTSVQARRTVDGIPVDLGAWQRGGLTTPAGIGNWRFGTECRLLGYRCGCPTPTSTRPAVVLDPFGGTGTTALVADSLDRVGISIDRGEDYQRIARWRTTDPRQRAKAAQLPRPPISNDDQVALF